jgi:pentalenene oxygenase
VHSALKKHEGPVASPRSHWLFGHQREFYADPIAFIAKAVGRFRTNIALKLQERTYVLVREQDVDRVLRRNAYNYQPAGISRIVPAFAGAVLGTPHPEHEPLRRWLAPFFRANELAAWVAVVSEILERRAADIPVGTTFDIAPVMRSINFEIASRIVVGAMPPQVMDRLDHLILKSHSYSTRVLRSFLRLPRWVPLRPHRVVRTVEREIDTIFHSLISRDSANKPPSILDQMLAERSRGEGRPLKDLRYTAAGLLLAACEPVAMTTTMALHLLGKDPALQNRIVDELARVKSKLGAAPISHLDLRELVLLNGFIDEVHRLYPAEWLLTREAIRTDRLPSGLLIRGGDRVMIDLNCFHRNADRFPDPDRCNPDRFRQGGMKPNGSYLPFGAGATVCLGQSLARLIILMSLVTMLTKWRIESLEADIGLDSLNCFSIAPKGPVSLSLHEREAAIRGSETAAARGHTVACPYAGDPPPAPA